MTKDLCFLDRLVLDEYAKAWGFKSWEHWKKVCSNETHSNKDLEEVVVLSRKNTEKHCAEKCDEYRAHNDALIDFVDKTFISISRLKELIAEQKLANPYPEDVFTGKTKEGEIGKFAGKVWIDCLNELLLIIEEDMKERNEESRGEKKNE